MFVFKIQNFFLNNLLDETTFQFVNKIELYDNWKNFEAWNPEILHFSKLPGTSGSKYQTEIHFFHITPPSLLSSH